MIRYLDQIAKPERDRILHAIRAQWNKPRVSRHRQQWRVRLGGIEETRVFDSWTEAVAFAKQWHSNVSHNGLIPPQNYWPGKRWSSK